MDDALNDLLELRDMYKSQTKVFTSEHQVKGRVLTLSQSPMVYIVHPDDLVELRHRLARVGVTIFYANEKRDDDRTPL